MISGAKKEEIINDILAMTGPILKISDFDRVPALPAAQTIRNQISAKEFPREVLLKRGRHTFVDMKAYLPIWAKKLTTYE